MARVTAAAHLSALRPGDALLTATLVAEMCAISVKLMTAAATASAALAGVIT